MTHACITLCISWKNTTAFLSLNCKFKQNMLWLIIYVALKVASQCANIASNAAREMSVLYSVWQEFSHPRRKKRAPVISDTLETVEYVKAKHLIRPTTQVC